MGMNKDYHLTQAGLDELKSELEELKIRRIDVAEKLKEAKDQGDLSENSDWANAQDEFKFVEGRVNEIEHIIQNVKIITDSKKTDKVRLGSTVYLEQGNKKAEYSVVGSLESDPQSGKISDESPIGKALLGKAVGEMVDIVVPAGTTRYKIVKIT